MDWGVRDVPHAETRPRALDTSDGRPSMDSYDGSLRLGESRAAWTPAAGGSVCARMCEHTACRHKAQVHTFIAYGPTQKKHIARSAVSHLAGCTGLYRCSGAACQGKRQPDLGLHHMPLEGACYGGSTPYMYVHLRSTCSWGSAAAHWCRPRPAHWVPPGSGLRPAA